MSIKARDTVTLVDITDCTKIVTWYQLISSTATAPTKPTTTKVSESPTGWTTTEPAFTTGSSNTLYTCQQNVFGDGTVYWGDVQKSSSYEAAKQAYNNAQNATKTANEAINKANVAKTTADGKNKIFYSASTPTAEANGDLWYKLDSKNNIIGIYIWNGSAWNVYTLIASDVIATGTITGTQIEGGTITGDKIKSNSVSTSKLTVTDLTNYVRLSPDNLTVNNWTYSYEKTTAGGVYTVQSVAGIGVPRDLLLSDEWYPVQPNQSLNLTADVSSNIQGHINTTDTADSYINVAIGVWGRNDSTGTNYYKLGASVVSSSTADWHTVTYDYSFTSSDNITSWRPWICVSGQWSTLHGTLKLRNVSARNTANGKLIVDGSITSTELASGSVTAGKLAAGSVQASNIVSGAVTTDKLGAKSVTTDKLVVGSGTNLYPNYDDFQNITNSTLYWDGHDLTTNVGTGNGIPVASRSIDCKVVDKFTVSTAQHSYIRLGNVKNNYGTIPVVKGKTYIVSWYSTAPKDIVHMQCLLFNTTTGGGRITDSATKRGYFFLSNESSETLTTDATWYRCWGTLTIPNDSNNWLCMGLTVLTTAASQGKSFSLGGIQIETGIAGQKPSEWHKAGTTLIDGDNIIAGTVTATQMKTGTITASSGVISSLSAGVLTTGTLDTARIAAGSIDSSKLKAGAVEVGGRNLLSFTQPFGTARTAVGYLTTCNASLSSEEYRQCKARYYTGTLSDTTGTKQIVIYDGVSPITSGGCYTASFWAKGSGKLSLYFNNGLSVINTINSQGITGTNHSEFSLINTWNRYWVVFTLEDDSSKANAAKSLVFQHDGSTGLKLSVYLAGLKLEESKFASGYSLAPEDLTNYVDSNADKVNLIRQSTLSDTAYNSTTKNWTPVTANTVSKYEFTSEGMHYIVPSTSTVWMSSAGIYVDLDDLGISKGDTIAISAEVKGTYGSTNAGLAIWHGTGTSTNYWAYNDTITGSYPVEISDWTRVGGIYTIPDTFGKSVIGSKTGNFLYIFFGGGKGQTKDLSGWVRNVKLERGISVTDFTLAPSDYADNAAKGITDNIYYTGTTLINGGRIKTDTLTALGAVTAGSFNLGSGNFTVTSNGVLTAKGATINGTINGSSGSFGGFTIESGSIHTTGKAVTDTSDKSVALASTPFTRTIGGTSRSNLELAIGSNFGVDQSGNAYINNANVAGNITATSGTIGGCSIVNNVLKIKNANIGEKLTANSIDLTVGGRNLLRDTEWMTTWANSGGWTVSSGIASCATESTAKVDTLVCLTGKKFMAIPATEWLNKTLTFSAEVKSTGGTWAANCFLISYSLYNSNDTRMKWADHVIGSFTPTSSWQTVSETVTMNSSFFTSGTYTGDISSLYLTVMIANSGTAQCSFKHAKLELGDVATAWSPAPEDVTDYVFYNNTTQINGGNIKTGSIESSALKVDKLSAISANLGTVNAGTLNAVDINSATIKAGYIHATNGDSYWNLDNVDHTDSSGITYTKNSFKFGAMQSLTENSNDSVENGDVYFSRAVHVTYGLELYGDNKNKEPYIDFHPEATGPLSISKSSTFYDYAGRISMTDNGHFDFKAPKGMTDTPKQSRFASIRTGGIQVLPFNGGAENNAPKDSNIYFYYNTSSPTDSYNSRICCKNSSLYVYCNGSETQGNIYAANTTGSSYHIKHDIKKITEEDGKKVLKLDPVTFTYDGLDLASAGFIAEDMLEKIPQVVVKPDDYIDDEHWKEGDDTLGIQYSAIIPYIVKLCQMQEKEIRDLKDKVEQQREDIDKLTFPHKLRNKRK